MSLSLLRKSVDSFAPSAGRLFRVLRDLYIRRQVTRTKYGFTLAGDPVIGSENFEAEEVATFLELLETHDIAIDIGANIGLYSCLASSRGKHVLAFEPSPRNLKFLYRNLWANKFPSAEVFPLGLARSSGLTRMYGFGGIASFVMGWGQAETSRYTVVPITTLDSVVARRFAGSKLLIKVDVEGFEMEVLAGATETLQLSPKPTWMIEILLQDGVIPGGINTRFHDTFAMFRKHGYQCRKLDKTRELVESRDIERWITCGVSGCKNFLFTSL
jgi:FkbM family methyltransferase